jgi:hypothetical protein
MLGYDPREYNMIFGLLGKADHQGNLSESDWQKVVTVFQDPNVKIHQEAIGVMMSMSHSPRRNQILALVKPQLNSPDLGVEVNALTLLWKFNDPSWRSEALKRQNRPEERMRLCVEDILSKGDVKQ